MHGPKILLRLATVLSLVVLSSIAVGRARAQVIAPEVTLPGGAGDDTEMAVAVDPTDALHLVVGAIDIQAHGCRSWVSRDGGATWQTTPLVNAPMRYCTDPVVAMAADGTAYFAGYIHDHATSGTQVVDINTRIAVWRSTDGGATWGAPVFAHPAVANQKVDKPWIAIDTTANGANRGTIYVAWTVLDTLDAQLDHRWIRASVSRDGGTTFEAPLDVSATGSTENHWGAHVAVGPQGEVFIAWRQFAPSQLRIAESLTGGRSWGALPAGSDGKPGLIVRTLGPMSDVPGVRATRIPVVAVSPARCWYGPHCESSGGINGCVRDSCDVHVAYFDAPPASPQDVELVTESGPIPAPNVAYGINSLGEIVGAYDVDTSTPHGFLHDGAGTRLLAVVRGINDHKQVVGHFMSTDNVWGHGFVLDASGWPVSLPHLAPPYRPPVTVIGFPGVHYTWATAIDDRGRIVGGFSDATGSHGFLLNGDPALATSFQILDVPGGNHTQPSGIADDGSIAGTFVDADGRSHGFLLRGDPALAESWKTIDYPGGLGETVLHGMNGPGEIVGGFQPDAGTGTSFVVRHAGTAQQSFTPFPAGSGPIALNDAGEWAGTRVVGGYPVAVVGTTSTTMDVRVASSRDGGLTWPDDVRVNDRIEGDQFFPWMCADSRGRLHVAWLDRRNDPANRRFDLYTAVSTDGGQRFTANRRVSSASSDPARAALQDGPGVGFIGDYIGLACAGDTTYAGWPDLRDANQDVHVAALACGLRDLGDGTVLDLCTDLQWRQDATIGGEVSWTDAVAAVKSLQLGGFADWRLPRVRFPDSTCREAEGAPVAFSWCFASEVPQLRVSAGIEWSHPGPFNLASSTYWGGSQVWTLPWEAHDFGIYADVQGSHGYLAATWPVRDVWPGEVRSGTSVTVTPSAGVTATFTSVTTPGTASVVETTNNPGAGTPDFRLLGRFWDVTSSAVLGSGATVTVCFTYRHGDLPSCANGCPAQEAALSLLHLVGTTWQDVTTSRDPVANVVCGTVSTLSWFAIGQAGSFYTITASLLGGSGSITPLGATTVAAGGSQAYVITPASGYRINYVAVNGASVGAVPAYTVANVSKDTTIRADFVPITYTITVTQTPNGTITPSTYGGYRAGTSQTFSVRPNAGYHVADVVVDGVSVGAVGSHTVTNIQASHAITATFAANPSYTITATAGANGAITPAGTTTLLGGLSQKYTITPSAGFRVGAVLVDGVARGAITSFTFSAVSASHTIEASFVRDEWVITASVAGGSGTITPLGDTTVPGGGSMTYTIAPAAGYKINYVAVNGASVGKVTSYTFSNVRQGYTIRADFVPITYTITVTQTPNGYVTPDTYAGFTAGMSQTYAIKPNTGYVVADVQVDGASVGAVTSYTFTGIAADHAIAATFATAP